VLDAPPLFLTADDVIEYHSEQIKLYGGLDGIADRGLLESAVASPQHLFVYVEQATIFDIATAYAFHISENQPFNEGNKRTGLQAALAFLKGNGFIVETAEQNLFDWTRKMARREMSQEAFSDALRRSSIREGGLTFWIRGLYNRLS
jgi:death-on-curing protein